MFKHQFLERFLVSEENTPDGRIYKTSSGIFPSVTTIISKHFGKDGIDAWRERIGQEEADQIVMQASNKGNAIHELCQKYLKNESNWKKGSMPVNLDGFLRLKSALDNNIQIIYGIEHPLFSERLKTAGTSDLICVWSGLNAIVDYKTSNREVETSSEKLLKYKIQATAYGMMVEEQYNMNVDIGVILVLVDHEPVQVVEFSNHFYRSQVENIFINERK